MTAFGKGYAGGDTWQGYVAALGFFFFFATSVLFFLTLQILANIIIFTCGNLAGAYHKHLMDLALRQTYQDTCNCIKSPIKLEFEKYQQVQKTKVQQTANLSQHVFEIFTALLVSLLVEWLLSLLLWPGVRLKACQIPGNYLITNPSGERPIKFLRRKTVMGPASRLPVPFLSLPVKPGS